MSLLYKKKRNQELLEDGLEKKNENLYTEWRNVQKRKDYRTMWCNMTFQPSSTAPLTYY